MVQSTVKWSAAAGRVRQEAEAKVEELQSLLLREREERQKEKQAGKDHPIDLGEL